MLVLSRKLQENIMLKLPDDRWITITLVDIDKNKVRLGIACDKDIPIYREELLSDDDRRKIKDASLHKKGD